MAKSTSKDIPSALQVVTTISYEILSDKSRKAAPLYDVEKPKETWR
jgi:hypothetical protein